jgi:hypothetical protein
VRPRHLQPAWRWAACVALGLALASHATAARAQRPADVRGIVFDSLAGRPLVGALVQLATLTDEGGVVASASTDSTGRYVLHDVPSGRYRLGFFHARLDSLGLAAPLRELAVERDHVDADLAILPAERIRASLCRPAGERSTRDAGALLVGIVRTAHDGTPVRDAAVTVAWNELLLSSTGSERRRRTMATRTAANGWYGLCDVPQGGTVTVRAALEGDSTDALELLLPPSALAQRDLYLAGRPSAADSTIIAGAAATLPVRGRVVMDDADVPIEGADVRIERVGATRTNALGEWTLAAVPPGTRMVEVRAVGYFRERVPLDVLEGGTRATIALRSLRPALDTVRIRAERDRENGLGGFEARRRSGTGRYLSADEIARRNVIVVSEVFNTMPAMRVERADDGNRRIALNSVFGASCEPVVFINGMRLGPLSADELDAFTAPEDVLGIEVYREPSTPPQFSDSMAGTGCGSIVLWTRVSPRRRR